METFIDQHSNTQSFHTEEAGRPKVELGADPNGNYTIKLISGDGLAPEVPIDLKGFEKAEANTVYEALQKAIAEAFDQWNPRLYRSVGTR
jgi:hypothetical protein